MTQAAKTHDIFTQTAKPRLSVVGVDTLVESGLELFYVHAAVPVVGSRIGAKGECDFELVGTPIDARMTPVQVRQMMVAKADIEARKYRGIISHTKGDNGMVAGYVWAFKNGKPMDTVSIPAPKMPKDWRFQDDVMGEIAMIKAIAAKRNPTPKIAHVKCVCGG